MHRFRLFAALAVAGSFLIPSIACAQSSYASRHARARAAQRRSDHHHHTGAKIVGGSAAGGAVVGGLLGGKKGALIGAGAGAGGGAIANHERVNHDVHQREQTYPH